MVGSGGDLLERPTNATSSKGHFTFRPPLQLSTKDIQTEMLDFHLINTHSNLPIMGTKNGGLEGVEPLLLHTELVEVACASVSESSRTPPWGGVSAMSKLIQWECLVSWEKEV